MSDPASGSGRQWHFDWRLLLFTGLFLPLLVSLGFWQLERASQKSAQLAQWETPGGELDWASESGDAIEAGQPVTLTGRYREMVWLLDNRTRDGAPGYEVLTLFEPDIGPVIVINRGWIQAPRRRDELPEIGTPAATVTLAGRLSEYPEPPVLMETTEDSTQWPKRVQALTRSNVASVGVSPPSLVMRLADPDQPGAYRADWAPDYMGPQTHYGYAVQWFSLSLALIILTVVASYRKTGNNDDDG